MRVHITANCGWLYSDSVTVRDAQCAILHITGYLLKLHFQIPCVFPVLSLILHIYSDKIPDYILLLTLTEVSPVAIANSI